MPSLKAGQWLFNRRYELLRPLGAGGMGVVWLARDHTEEVEVALKFLPTILVLQEGEMKRLKEEVRAGKELRHPGIVATYGLEVEDSTAAIVMEYVPGKTLMERLEAQARGFFEPAEITGWLRGIAEAIDYLHTGAKRVHRDLKPANIIVDAAGEARLMDFGISHRIQEGVTRQSLSNVVPASAGSEPEPAKAGTTNNSSSTLAYASPQQITGKPAHPADDLYSLGATLYELLTGTPPFYRGGTEAVGLQIKTEPPTPIHERRAELVHEGANASTGENVPEAVEKAVLACLAKTREQRPASASRVIQSFSSPSAPKRPSTPGSSEVSPAKPTRVPPRGLSGPLWRALAALLLLAAAGWAWKAFFPPDNRLDQLPHSPKDLEEAASRKAVVEMAMKNRFEELKGESHAAEQTPEKHFSESANAKSSSQPATATRTDRGNVQQSSQPKPRPQLASDQTNGLGAAKFIAENYLRAVVEQKWSEAAAMLAPDSLARKQNEAIAELAQLKANGEVEQKLKSWGVKDASELKAMSPCQFYIIDRVAYSSRSTRDPLVRKQKTESLRIHTLGIFPEGGESAVHCVIRTSMQAGNTLISELFLITMKRGADNILHIVPDAIRPVTTPLGGDKSRLTVSLQNPQLASPMINSYFTAIVNEDWQSASRVILPSALAERRLEAINRIQSAPTMSEETALLQKLGANSLGELQKLTPEEFYIRDRQSYHAGISVTDLDKDKKKNSLRVMIIGIAEEKERNYQHVVVRTYMETTTTGISELFLISLAATDQPNVMLIDPNALKAQQMDLR
ncbi:MAG: serine/threonine protein kinase [Verrucomicrobiaceae bacterium]|nr:serine/threonine protein kinase [Verrucomicrobiaceae bacterium]